MDTNPHSVRNVLDKLAPSVITRDVGVDHGGEGVYDEEGRHPAQPLRRMRGYENHVFVDKAGYNEDHGDAIKRRDAQFAEGCEDASVGDVAEEHVPSARPKVARTRREEGRVAEL
jgi:hypothetical protein